MRSSTLLLGLMVGGLLAGCSAPSSAAGAARAVQVVAGENFWGSIAAQLGGSHASVTSIVTNPNADPHEYESSPTDARAFAQADYVIINGAGYDDWARKLLDANPSSSRRVLVVADLLGKHPGDNPHFWYNPSWVHRVSDRITADYKAVDAPNASSYDTLHASWAAALAPYDDLIATIRRQFSGMPVASTESIFVYLAQALGLNLISSPDFMQAVSEGNDPPASTVATFHNQLLAKQVRLLVYNNQTVTAVTGNLRALAQQQAIPVVGVSETILPPTLRFDQWQIAQLQTIQKAVGTRASLS